jgi:hypothetical protein
VRTPRRAASRRPPLTPLVEHDLSPGDDELAAEEEPVTRVIPHDAPRLDFL